MFVNFLQKKAKHPDFFYKYPRQRIGNGKYFFTPNEKDWEIVRKQLQTIVLTITLRCNSFCKACFQNSSPFVDRKRDMKIDEIKEILRKIGKKKVMLFGGEPTVHPKIFEIVRLIRKYGCIPEIYTNGLKISDLKFLKAMKKAGISRVYISFDGFDEKIYSELRGGREEFLLKMKALKNLISERVETIITSVIAKGLNEDQIKPLLDFSIKMNERKTGIVGIKFFGLTYSGPEVGGRFLLKKSHIMKTKDLLEIISDSRKDISSEYLFEFKKFMINAFYILGKFGISFPAGTPALYGVYFVRSGKLYEVIPLHILKALNKGFEEGKYKKIVKELMFRNKGFLLRFLKINPLFIRRSISKQNFFILTVGNINLPYNHKGLFADTVEIIKDVDGVIKFKTMYDAASDPE